ncbi:type II toxin-antitoxin system VapC family toxin [Candidatus Woesearchaeota archaeon]|nr:type II toxin-antitoxin system VapC family toxin [Candidatus Woesearchaeota archaeon]
MNLIFDTSTLIELERKNKKVIDKIKEYIEIYPSPAKITFINYFEFYYGLMNKNIKNKDKALSFVHKFNMLKVSKRTAEILAELKQKYDKNGEMLPLADLLIASQTIENGGILVTLDTDFRRIEELNKLIL